jgi:uncharacterized membrane protein
MQRTEKRYERLLYQVNSASYALAMLFLVSNTYQTILTLNAVDVMNAGIFIAGIILLNIFLSFVVFIIASEMKRYNLRWSYTALGIGVFECVRVFWISPTIAGIARTHIVVSLLLGGILLLIAGCFSVDRCRKRLASEKGE